MEWAFHIHYVFTPHLRNPCSSPARQTHRENTKAQVRRLPGQKPQGGRAGREASPLQPVPSAG